MIYSISDIRAAAERTKAFTTSAQKLDRIVACLHKRRTPQPNMREKQTHTHSRSLGVAQTDHVLIQLQSPEMSVCKILR